MLTPLRFELLLLAVTIVINTDSWFLLLFYFFRLSKSECKLMLLEHNTGSLLSLPLSLFIFYLPPNRGMAHAFKKIHKAEGSAALARGISLSFSLLLFHE